MMVLKGICQLLGSCPRADVCFSKRLYARDEEENLEILCIKISVTQHTLGSVHSSPPANINIKTVRTLAVCSDISDGWREERTGGVQHHLATYWIRMWILARQSHIRLYQIHERRLGDGEVLRAALIAQEIFSFNSTESCNEHTNCEAQLTGRRQESHFLQCSGNFYRQ